MKIKTKVVVSILLSMALTTPGSAMASKEKVLDHGPLIAAVDTDRDGRMSLAEWQAAGLPMSSFNGLNQDGYVTEKMMMAEGAPDGIDINGDGVLTIEEFLEFDKMMAPRMAAADDRPTISEGEAAYASWQVQNVMSKHAYYHAAGMHLEELADIWVEKNGPNAATATFASPGWIMKGVAAVKKYYGQGNQANKVKELETVSKLYPDIKNVPENLGVGHEYAMHTNTTPIIEIAGDGKTAKGIWYSPGIGLSAKPRENGEVVAGGTFFWEKYGADFVKENGAWKIWHCQMFYDFTPQLPASMLTAIGTAREDGPGGPGGPPPAGAPKTEAVIEAGEKMKGSESKSEDMVDNPNKYQNYSVTRVPTITPAFPEPYYTFSETFSY